jgi:hypothetical protein
MRFVRYHGLGNDYLVLDEAEAGHALTPERIRLICHRNCGVGADGILLGPIRTVDGGLRVRIFNPDGSYRDKPTAADENIIRNNTFRGHKTADVIYAGEKTVVDNPGAKVVKETPATRPASR